MQINLSIRYVQFNLTLPISTDDTAQVSTLLPTIQSHIPTVPTKWDLCFGSTRLLPERTLASYSVHDGATLWVQQRAHSLDHDVRPLALLCKEAGSARTTSMNFLSSYTVAQCKHELVAALESGGGGTGRGVCLFQKAEEGRLRDSAKEEMKGAREMADRGTLGGYGVVDREVLLYCWDGRGRRVKKRVKRVVEGGREVVHKVAGKAKDRMGLRGRGMGKSGSEGSALLGYEVDDSGDSDGGGQDSSSSEDAETDGNPSNHEAATSHAAEAGINPETEVSVQPVEPEDSGPA